MQNGLKKCPIIEKPVKGCSFDDIVKYVREVFSDVSGAELQSLILEALATVRNKKQQAKPV